MRVEKKKQGIEEKELFDIIKKSFGRDVKFLVLKFLASKEVASIREIAGKVGMSPKNLSKYLDYLADKGIVEVAYQAKNIKLYRTAQKAEILKKFMRAMPRRPIGKRSPRQC